MLRHVLRAAPTATVSTRIIARNSTAATKIDLSMFVLEWKEGEGPLRGVSGSGPSWALAESLGDRWDGGRLGSSQTQLGTALLSRSVLQITNNEVRLILWSLARQCGFLATIRNNSLRLAASCLARVTIHRRNGGPDLRGLVGDG